MLTLERALLAFSVMNFKAGLDMYVQFDGADLKAVQSVFSGPQDEKIYPNQGEIEESDERYLAFIDSLKPSIAELNQSYRDAQLTIAALRIAPLQDAVDLDDATEDESNLLKQWKQYRVSINRIDINSPTAEWPKMPE